MFIETDKPDKVHGLIYKEKNFIKILETDAGYAPISEAEEELIRHFTGEGGIAGISVGVIHGGELRVLDGPLKGMESNIIRIDRHRKKAWVHFDNLLGESRDLTFGLEVVEKD